MSYDNGTGVITYVGPSASEVRAHFTAGNGISISSGQINSTITQYTDSDARAAITVTDAGGDGSITYIGGTITYTGPGTTDYRAAFSAGTGIGIASGVIKVYGIGIFEKKRRSCKRSIWRFFKIKNV